MSYENQNADMLKYCPHCAKTLAPPTFKMIRCPWCGLELYLNTAAAATALIADDRGRLLLVVRGKDPAKGLLDLPGGFVDPGESAEDALRREVLEEVGLEVATSRYFASAPNYYEYKGITYATCDLAFLCQIHDLAPLRARDEVQSIAWLAPTEIQPSQLAFPSTRRIVSAYAQSVAPSR